MPGRGRVRGAVHVAARPGRRAGSRRRGLCPTGHGDGARAPGRAVHVLVRPEHVEADPPPGAPNRLEGRVGAVRYLGAVTRYDFEVPGRPRPFSRKAACRSPAPSPSIPRVFACWTIDPISLAAQGASRCNADDSSRPPAPCRWRRWRGARPPWAVPSYMPARRRCTKRRARKGCASLSIPDRNGPTGRRCSANSSNAIRTSS